MEKLKNVGRFRRTSTGPAEFRTGQSPKNPLSRLAGLFGRTHHRKTGPPGPVSSPSESSIGQHIAPVSYRDYRIASASISSFDNHDRPFSLPDGRNTFRGQRPPAEGYFAHESPESFFLAQSQHSVRAAASTDYLRLSDPTPVDAGRLSHHLSPPYHSPPISQHPPHTSSPRLSSPIRSRSPRTPPSRGRSEERTYAQELHLRSRSPKAFAPRPEERNLPKHDPTDPAFKLGTFRSSNPRTSRIGDQELPWKITIPGDSDDEPVDRSTSWRQETEGVLDVTRLPTYQEDAEEHGHTEHAGDVKQDSALSNRSTTSNDTRQPPPDPAPAEHPHRSGARAINTVDTPVELPVRTGDDSDEEIMMSSTAYPGQEWRPVGFSEWEHQ
ncbi:hypothetical protein BJX61DRAFT_43208 [Aspergillus egyptiacus]|nr:hypothetical protein BJX61DRAFT_43208 [Aspergillus egyptiacus]